MRLYFSSEFKNEIQEIGNTVTLMYLSLDDNERKIEFQSLWDNIDKVLNMSIDLSDIGKDYQDPSTITVWYGDLSGEIIGEAFRLSSEPGETLNLCWKKRDENNTRDLNHVRVKFPSITVSNIETLILSSDIKFLEKVSPGMEGINTFLAMEGEYEDKDYITKESYKTYLRNTKSISNTDPLYLDKNGEKVTTKTQYRHYKQIVISAADYVGQPFEGKTRYTVSNGEGVEISGQCIYDLYQVSNGEYTLLGKDLKMDITNTILANVDPETGNIDDSLSDNYTIEGHRITFNTGSDSDTLDFIAILNFTPEIEDIELGYTKGIPAKVKSNILEFVTYLKWNVEYPTSLVHTDGNLVLVFDYQEGASVWSTAKEPQREGIIRLYSESKINPLTDISITTEREEDQYVMSTFFDIILPEDGKYDVPSRRYYYDIKIQTKSENVGSSRWFPLDNYGDSVLILNTITVLGSTANATSKVKFYCVQRPYYPLRVVKGLVSHSLQEVGEDGLKFSPGIGVRNITNIYVANPAEGYDTWEAEYEDLDSDVIIYSMLNTVVDTEVTTVMPVTPSITASTRVPGCFGESLELGKIKFHRRNTNGEYDPTYWKDLIYCHEDNSFVLNLGAEMMSSDGTLDLPIYCDPGRQNYSDLKYAPTKYFYKDENSINRRLYLFEPEGQDTKSFIASTGGNISISVTYSNQVLFETYFDLSISYPDQKTALITIGSKGRRSDDSETSWYPKSSDLPISVTITDSSTGRAEIFYCIIKPSFSPLTLMEKTEDGYSVISKLEFTDEKNLIESGGVVKHRQICYLTSDSVISEFPYWTVFSKDSEIKVFTENPATMSTWTNSGNILSSDPSVWGNQVPYITIDTSTVPYGPDDVEFEPLVLQRTTDSSHVGSLSELYGDWKNQLCEDVKAVIPISLKSNIKSDSLTLLTYKKNSTVIEEIEDNNIDLDYIGLYRLIVKSSGSFRVRLGSTNSLDGIYFFDPSNNERKPNVLTLDEGAFDEINGREVCFVFYGFEDKAFEVESQVLRTKIYVTNLTDGTTKALTLTRKYFSRTSSLGVLESPVIDSNIRAVSTVDKDWFLPSSGEAMYKPITYKSNIETYTEYVPYDSENYKASVFVSDPTGQHDIRYSSYQIQSQVKRGTKITTFCSRGYLSTEMKITCSGIGEGDGYPISPDGVIEIKNPGEMYRVTREKLSTSLYCLLPAPTITTNYDSGLRQMMFQYTSGKSLTLYVNAENGVYDIDYHVVGSVDYTPIESGMMLSDSNGNEHFRIDREPTLDQELGQAWKITSVRNYEDSEDENLLVGGIRVRTYVPYDKFIKDASGIIRTDYSQEQVNSFVRPEEKNITLLRLSKKNSDDSIEGGNPDTLIDRNGETRVFLLNKVEEDSVVDTEAFKDGWSSYISEIGLNEDSLELSVTYKDRLTRHDLGSGNNLGSIRYIVKTVGGNSTYVLSDGANDALAKMLLISNPILSNFSIKVGDNEVSSSGIYQNPWSKGISINGYGYVGNKSGQPYSIESGGGSVVLYIFGFDLPTTGDYSDRDNSNIKINKDALNVTCNSLNYSLGTFEDKVTNPTTTNGAVTSGWKYVFTVPENTGNYTETYYVYVEDTYGNKVTIPIYSNPRSSFNVRFFKTYSSGTLSNETDSVIFTASGQQRGDLYLATDDLSGTYSPTIITSYYSSSVYNSSGERISGSVNFSNSITSSSVVDYSSAVVQGEDSGVHYRVYKIVLKSVAYQFTSSTGSILTNPLASGPYKKNMDVGINSSSYKTLTCYHGSCSIQLTQPAKTYLSVKVDDSGTETFMDYIPEFREGDNAEYDKYTSSGSFLLSNNKPTNSTSYSKTYRMDNYVNISYSEQGSTGESKYEANFDKYGYYCGWKILIVRREWFEEDGVLVVRNLESEKGIHPTITTAAAAKIDTSMNMEKEYYNFSSEPELIFVAFYEIGSSATSTEPPSGSSDPTVGVLMIHRKSEFRENGKNYTLINPRQIAVMFNGWEAIQFYVNLTLDFTNN